MGPDLESGPPPASNDEKMNDTGNAGNRAHVKRNPVLRALAFAGGCVSLGLGGIGIVLPILPTVPFVLLAGFLFMQSSEKVYRWLRYHPRFQHMFEKRGLTLKAKVLISAWAWTILIFGIIFTPITWIRILLVAVGVVKIIFFAKFIPTITSSDAKRSITGKVAQEN